MQTISARIEYYDENRRELIYVTAVRTNRSIEFVTHPVMYRAESPEVWEQMIAPLRDIMGVTNEQS